MFPILCSGASLFGGHGREDGIHRKYAFAYPTIQIPGGRNRFLKIIVDFFEYIHQGTGIATPSGTEKQTHSIAPDLDRGLVPR